MAEPWHYAHDGNQFGPVDGKTLKRLAASGELKPEDLIWKERTAKWVKAAAVKGLFPDNPAKSAALPDWMDGEPAIDGNLPAARQPPAQSNPSTARRPAANAGTPRPQTPPASGSSPPNPSAPSALSGTPPQGAIITEYCVMAGGERRGPLSLDRLSGQPLSGGTPLWHPGLSGWTRADGVPELATLLASLPPAASPAPMSPARPSVAPAKPAHSPPPANTAARSAAMLLVVGLALVVLRIAGCWPQEMPIPLFDPYPAERIAKEVAGAKGLPVTAADLQREYEANGVVADRKYKGKVLEISGTIRLIQRGDWLSKPQLYCGSVCCEFEHEGDLEHLTCGRPVTVKGKYDGNERLTYCVVLP